MATGSPLILIVEDDAIQAQFYRHALDDLGLALVTAASLAEARTALVRHRFVAALVDLQLPDGSGVGLIREIHARSPNCVVVMASGVDSVDTALESTRAGASDYLVKPITVERLNITMRNVLETSRLRSVVRTMESTGRFRFHNFIGTSPAMQAVYRMIETVSQSKAPVFILGESGTGKELCAEAIHSCSQRGDRPFIAINCAAIPSELIESELFGHVKGAFTGAASDRPGAALAADGGTLFLDEICEMDINVQAKLLRLLQTGEVKRVGENKTQRVDIRIVCATNRDPFLEMNSGRFREDLYYRLFVLPIELPPLRERGADVMLIAQTMLGRYAEEEGKQIKEFSPAARDLLVKHAWPGNVRELLNVVRAAVIYTAGAIVEPATIRQIFERGTKLPSDRGEERGRSDPSASPARHTREDQVLLEMTASTVMPLADLERSAIEKALSLFGGNVGRAADALGVNTSTLYRKIKSWGGTAPS